MIDHDDIMVFSTSVSCFVNCKKTQKSSGTFGCLGFRREGPGGGGTTIHYPYGYVPPNGVSVLGEISFRTICSPERHMPTQKIPKFPPPPREGRIEMQGIGFLRKLRQRDSMIA